MSSNRFGIYLTLGILAVLAFFFWRHQNSKPKFDWHESSFRKKNSYSEASDQPYGTQIAYRMLDEIFPGKDLHVIEKSLARELPTDSGSVKNYVFVGEAMFMDSADTERLLEFVRRGNTALVSSKTIPYDLMFHLYDPECGGYAWDDYSEFMDTTVRLCTESPDVGHDSSAPLSFRYVRQNVPDAYRWHFVDANYLCEENGFAALGYVSDSLINFIEIPLGKGFFYLHTNPIAFSNYHLLRPQGQTYAAAIFSRLREGDIFWDKYSRTSEAVGRRRNEMRGNSPRRLPEEHALTYILKQPALAWAWYLLAAMGLIWLIFRAKRRQRIVPVLPKNENSSLEFLSAIAHLHFREKDYRRLSIQKMKLFLAHLRDRYGLATPHDPEQGSLRVEESFVQRLARQAEAPEAMVRDIFLKYQALVQYEPTETMMTDFHLAVERFVKKAK